MISIIYARVLEELKRINGTLPVEQEIALREFDKLGTTPEAGFEWKKKHSLALT